jgi:hypothetical protein
MYASVSRKQFPDEEGTDKQSTAAFTANMKDAHFTTILS